MNDELTFSALSPASQFIFCAYRPDQFVREYSHDPCDWFHLDSFATCLDLELQVFVVFVLAFLYSTSFPQLASRLSFGYGACTRSESYILAVRGAHRCAKARTGRREAELRKDRGPDNQNRVPGCGVLRMDWL